MITQSVFSLIESLIEYGDHVNEVYVGIIGLQTALIAAGDKEIKHYLGRLFYNQSILIDSDIILNEVRRVCKSLGNHSTEGIIPIEFLLLLSNTMYEELEDFIVKVSAYNLEKEALISATGKISSISMLLEQYLIKKERMTTRRAKKQCEALGKVLETCEDFRNVVSKLTYACLNREVQQVHDSLETGILVVKKMKHQYYIYQEFYTRGFRDYGFVPMYE